MKVLDTMPTLSRGPHAPGDGKACIMEYVALLAGEPWTDHPKCTHEMLAETAQVVNDVVDDGNRHLLVPLIGRFFGTNSDVVGLAPALFGARQQAGYDEYCTDVICGCESCVATTFVSPEARRAQAEKGVEILTKMLDAYDAYTGRTSHREIAEEEMAAAIEKVGAQ